MNTKFLFTICLFLFCFSANMVAQNNNGKNKQITGKVIANGLPLENAQVSLLAAKDSALVTTTNSGKNGIFVFTDVVEGDYLVRIQHLGYQKFFQKLPPLAEPVTNLNTCTLLPFTQQAEKVTIVSKKKMIEVKQDKIIVNVDANINNIGSTALEVLQQSPGVTVDKDGNISLKGNPSVVIYIDGRPSYLSGTDLTNLLTNMQSAQMETIEIMSNPPAKYDAAGNGGIINIKTKKNKSFGFNGSVSLNAGIGMVYPRFGETINLNYKKNKLNLFGNFSHSYREKYENLTINRKFINAGNGELVSLFSQVNEPFKINRDYSTKIGFDYTISKKTTLGAVVKTSYSPSDSYIPGTILLKNAVGQLDSTTVSLSGSNTLWKNFSTNVNYLHLIDTGGKEISVNMDYIQYNSTDQLRLSNSYFRAGLPSSKSDTLYGSLPQKIKIYSAKADYVMPISKSLQFEAGIKTSYIVTDADAAYDSIIGGIAIRALSRTNFFEYRENINAAYINLNKKYSEKFSVQTGLRFETTSMKGIELTTGKTFKRTLAQLFPTVYLQYSWNAKNNFVLNYGRRIKRPDYQSLNPFVEYLDKYTYEVGNPYLKPEFSHQIELTHTYKEFLSTTLNFRTTNNIIQQVFITNANKTETALQLDNIASSKAMGVYINLSLPVSKWFHMNTSLIGDYDAFSGLINNKKVQQNFARFGVRLDGQFKFAKGWTANLSSLYITGEMEGVLIINPLFNIDLGVGKSILKNKGSLKCSVKDILFTQKPTGYTRYDNVDVNFKQFSNSRMINLAFTYRFNKGTLKAGSQRKTGGAEEEQNRVSGN